MPQPYDAILTFTGIVAPPIHAQPQGVHNGKEVTSMASVNAILESLRDKPMLVNHGRDVRCKWWYGDTPVGRVLSAEYCNRLGICVTCYIGAVSGTPQQICAAKRAAELVRSGDFVELSMGHSYQRVNGEYATGDYDLEAKEVSLVQEGLRGPKCSIDMQSVETGTMQASKELNEPLCESGAALNELHGYKCVPMELDKGVVLGSASPGTIILDSITEQTPTDMSADNTAPSGMEEVQPETVANDAAGDAGGVAPPAQMEVDAEGSPQPDTPAPNSANDASSELGSQMLQQILHKVEAMNKDEGNAVQRVMDAVEPLQKWMQETKAKEMEDTRKKEELVRNAKLAEEKKLYASVMDAIGTRTVDSAEKTKATQPAAPVAPDTSVNCDDPQGVSSSQIQSLVRIIQDLKTENVKLQQSPPNAAIQQLQREQSEQGMIMASKSNPQGQMPQFGSCGPSENGTKRKAEERAPSSSFTLQAQRGDECEAGITLASKRQGNVGDERVRGVFRMLAEDVKKGELDQATYNRVTRAIKTDPNGFDLRGEIGHVCASLYYENERETDTGMGSLDSGHNYNMINQCPEVYDRVLRNVNKHSTKSAYASLSQSMPATFSK